MLVSAAAPLPRVLATKFLLQRAAALSLRRETLTIDDRTGQLTQAGCTHVATETF